MTWIDLGEPAPRSQVMVRDDYAWKEGQRWFLGVPDILHQRQSTLAEVVLRRRTRRAFRKVSDGQISGLLWLTSKCQEQGVSVGGLSVEHRPVPSAGALHPIHILLVLPDWPDLWRYSALDHSAVSIPGTSGVSATIRAAVNAIVEVQEGSILFFVADFEKTLSKYECGYSLVWRDAGVLLGHMVLVAEALGMNFCPVGINGHEWARLLDEGGQLAGVGLAILGSRL